MRFKRFQTNNTPHTHGRPDAINQESGSEDDTFTAKRFFPRKITNSLKRKQGEKNGF